ncbi:7-cyano-7-deazaguanine synthase in queuosine biosynthesis [Tissierella praeacuta]|uniref:Qat anti-phage system QueC-like protein QatC n=1 Tax=Tissierella praeacuta TaxID=43131 RepID=UPI00104945D9|nr:Qat anti-phage system QueC-like protein QatC [Tissierella praeacuta]TCU79432.1 7-cyano-7-deazaguanine synthase in queuosine biosynthesis [Tissierella praeacuta]
MRKIICYPHSSIPNRFDSDVDYFELFSRPDGSCDNVKPIGISLPQELKRYGIVPPISAIDFAAFAFSIVAVDKLISRDDSPDGWTRMIDLTIFLSEPEKWVLVKTKIEKMLRFLTGDFWTLTFQLAKEPAIQPTHEPRQRKNDCVCLLSGGMDSLVGAIDLLSEKRNPLFVSQIIRGDAKRQRDFANRFGAHNHCQWSIGRLRGPEGSTRARSIAFFAFALLASSGIPRSGGFTEIVVPENGFISLNVPLDANRIGSLSTKTTHPVYMALLQEIWDALGIKAKLILPYKYKTKGEVLKECKDRKLMQELIFETNSCGKFQRHGLRHCGVCVPCLVRRAAFLESGLQDATKNYHYDDISKSNSMDLTAVALAVKQVELSGINKFVKGNLSFASPEDRINYLGVVSRGINELKNFLKGYDIL